MEANIGISAANRKKVAQLLNALLADEFLLYVKLLNYHWNVKSDHFRDMHKLFLDLYEDQLQVCDDVAERVRSLDEASFGTMQEYRKHTQLKEHPGKKLTDQEMIRNTLEDYEAIIRTIRIIAPACMDKYADLGTNNFLLNLLEKQEKTAWMLRASLVK
jgi:starvation-inducible DNA-binding protein